jgi:Putative zinc-finger
MIEQHREVEELGAYVLGGLAEHEARAVTDHLAGCAQCREELAGLQEMADALEEVPEEFFLDGPPDDDLVLQRTLREVRRHDGAGAATSRRTRVWPGVAAAAVAGIVLAAGGVVLGRGTAPEPSVAPPVTTTSPAVPGTVTAEQTDPGTGASMAVTITPAAGWVRLAADVDGIPAGEECQLVVVGADGRERVAGSWLVSEEGARTGTSLSTFALVAPEDVREVRVENLAGKRFVSVRPA